jgi:hypothetical protein
MKTLKLGLIGIFLFSTMLINTNATAKSTPDSSATSLHTQLTKLIQKPNLKANGITEAEIQIQFTIDSKGEIHVLKVNSENDYLNEFVRGKLDNQKVNISNFKADLVYFLTVKFELV